MHSQRPRLMRWTGSLVLRLQRSPYGALMPCEARSISSTTDQKANATSSTFRQKFLDVICAKYKHSRALSSLPVSSTLQPQPAPRGTLSRRHICSLMRSIEARTAVNSRNHRAMLNHQTNIAITTSCLHGPKRRAKVQGARSLYRHLSGGPADVAQGETGCYACCLGSSSTRGQASDNDSRHG